MPKDPTPEESARFILAVFRYHLRVEGVHQIHYEGAALRLNDFAEPFSLRGRHISDFRPGMSFAIEHGWVVESEKLFYLTDAGYEEL